MLAYDVIKTLGNSAVEGASLLSSGLAKLAEGDVSGGLKDLFVGALELSVIPAASVAISVVLHEVQALQWLVFGGGRALTSTEKSWVRSVISSSTSALTRSSSPTATAPTS